jgi:hypothetical protein
MAIYFSIVTKKVLPFTDLTDLAATAAQPARVRTPLQRDRNPFRLEVHPGRPERPPAPPGPSRTADPRTSRVTPR